MSITGNLTRFRGNTSVQDSVSAAEWQARVELAAAHRYAEHSPMDGPYIQSFHRARARRAKSLPGQAARTDV